MSYFNQTDSSYKYLFTVFTPTYNRARTLHRVYESLKGQTFRDFEWLIVDDGSCDNTHELVASWQPQVDFPIRYLWQENQGKHVAFNLGIHAALGELLVTIDSDDACVPTALARLKYHWEAIPAQAKAQFSGVTALCMDQHGTIVGSKFPQDSIDSDSLEMRYKYRVTGEKWGFHRTAVLRQFPFPVIPGMNFVPESIVWRAIARKFRTRYVNEPLSIYFSDDRGVSDQLRASPPSRKAMGRALWCQSVLNGEIDWFRWAPERFLWSAFNYARFSFHVGTGALAQVRRLNNPYAKALWALMLPCAFIRYVFLDARTDAPHTPASAGHGLNDALGDAASKAKGTGPRSCACKGKIRG
jgi:glycosyltransferase involved in cell wall biosynthesis